MEIIIRGKTEEIVDFGLNLRDNTAIAEEKSSLKNRNQQEAYSANWYAIL